MMRRIWVRRKNEEDEEEEESKPDIKVWGGGFKIR
jgi:hypothetical protein